MRARATVYRMAQRTGVCALETEDGRTLIGECRISSRGVRVLPQTLREPEEVRSVRRLTIPEQATADDRATAIGIGITRLRRRLAETNLAPEEVTPGVRREIRAAVRELEALA